MTHHHGSHVEEWAGFVGEPVPDDVTSDRPRDEE